MAGRHQLEERVRAIIARSTVAHGQRAAISRALHHPRGWLTEYLTRKVQHLKLDELAALIPLLPLSAADLAELRGVLGPPDEDAASRQQRATLWSLWDTIRADHRSVALQDVAEVARLSGAIERLTVQVRERAARNRHDHDQLARLEAEAQQVLDTVQPEKAARAASPATRRKRVGG